MKRSLLSILLVISLASRSQNAPPTLWNAGGVCMPVPDKPDTALHLQRSLVRVNLYGGFAVTGAEYLISYTGRDSVSLTFHLDVAGRFPHPGFEKLVLIEPDLLSLRLDGDSLVSVRDSTGVSGMKTTTQHFALRFAPGQSRTLSIRSISRTYLSKLKDATGSKDGNAFMYSFGDAAHAWNARTGTGQLLVKLNDVSVNNVEGLMPKSGITGDMRHLQYGYALEIPKEDDNLVVWYQGAPPDFPFTRKVVPARDTLYRLLDQFPMAEFGRPDYVALDRGDFNTDRDSTFGTIVYYTFLSLPWLFLFGFLVFLMRKPKKKRTNMDSLDNE